MKKIFLNIISAYHASDRFPQHRYTAFYLSNIITYCRKHEAIFAFLKRLITHKQSSSWTML